MNSTNNISARMCFDNAKKILFDSWISNFKGDTEQCKQWVDGRKLSQSEIRLEVELNTANNIFTFGLTPNQANSTNVQFPTEQRLNLQDSLIVSEYAIYVGQPASRADTAWRLNTYGNANVFAATDANALNSTFYSNGAFAIKVNNDTVLPYRGLVNHWYIPFQQQVAALGAAAVQSMIRGAEDAFVTQEPNLLLIGSKNYQPQIILPGNLATAAAFMRCVLVFRGVLAQNSTVIN